MKYERKCFFFLTEGRWRHSSIVCGEWKIEPKRGNTFLAPGGVKSFSPILRLGLKNWTCLHWNSGAQYWPTTRSAVVKDRHTNLPWGGGDRIGKMTELGENFLDKRPRNGREIGYFPPGFRSNLIQVSRNQLYMVQHLKVGNGVQLKIVSNAK